MLEAEASADAKLSDASIGPVASMFHPAACKSIARCDICYML